MSMPQDSPGLEPDPDSPKPAEPDEPSLLGLFTTLARTGLFLEALQRECLTQHGLAFREYSVLRLLQRAPAKRLAPSLLAQRIVCTTGAMTKLVDRLVRTGLVGRAPDPDDRRGVLVELLPAGERLATDAAESYRVGRERVLEGVDEQTALRIHQSLAALLGALEADRNARSRGQVGA